MKKIFIAFIISMFMVSCSSMYEATANVNYDVCYPDKTVTYERTLNVSFNFDNNTSYKFGKDPSTFADNTYIFTTYSVSGTNYVSVRNTYFGTNGVITSSTAPMRINSYNINNVRKVSNKNKSNSDIKFKKINE